MTAGALRSAVACLSALLALPAMADSVWLRNGNRLEGNRGISQAEAAREKAKGLANSAQENRENRGRSGDRPDPPDRRPDPPNP